MEIISLVISAAALVVALVTLYFAIRIPRKIMVDQRYSDLLQEYRSSEMGGAILSVCHFYVTDCGKDVKAIGDKYNEIYEEQIRKPLKCGKPIDYAQTLHFQRRLIAQFYYDMAYLRYNLHCPRLSRKQLQYWFTESEVNLLAIILHMDGPAREVFEETGDVPDPGLCCPHCTFHDVFINTCKFFALSRNKKRVPMNKLLYKLYKEMDNLVGKKPKEKKEQKTNTIYCNLNVTLAKQKIKSQKISIMQLNKLKKRDKPQK
jgi:hypothetical protein